MSSKHEVFNDDLDMALAQNLKLAADLLAVTSERDKEIDELRAEVENYSAQIGDLVASRDIILTERDTLLAEVERLRAERDRFEQRVVDYVHALGRLRALIDKHNDECRECPVIVCGCA